MRTTFRMMGSADFITIGNGLLGTLAIFFLMLSVEDMSQPYFDGGIKADYIWAAMMCTSCGWASLVMVAPVPDSAMARCGNS